MGERFVPERAFPEEILEDLRQGVPEPVLYSGPLYTGNGDSEVLRKLRVRRDKLEALKGPGPSDEQLLARARQVLNGGEWPEVGEDPVMGQEKIPTDFPSDAAQANP